MLELLSTFLGSFFRVAVLFAMGFAFEMSSFAEARSGRPPGHSTSRERVSCPRRSAGRLTCRCSHARSEWLRATRGVLVGSRMKRRWQGLVSVPALRDARDDVAIPRRHGCSYRGP